MPNEISIIRPVGTGLFFLANRTALDESLSVGDEIDVSGSIHNEVVGENFIVLTVDNSFVVNGPSVEPIIYNESFSEGVRFDPSIVLSEPEGDPVELGVLNNNLPDNGSGWTLVTDQDFSDVGYPAAGTWQDPVTGSYWGIAQNRDGEYPTIVADATAPSGNGLVFRQNYAGVRDGFGPHFPTCSLGNGLEFFMGFYVKFAETWTNPSTSGIKWHIPFATLNGTNTTTGWLGLSRPPSIGLDSPEPMQSWVFDGTCPALDATCGIPASDNPNVVRFNTYPEPPSAGLMTRGQWHKVQYYMNKNPGIIRMWINDVMVMNRTGFVWSDPTGVFNSMQIGATRGGAAIWGGDAPASSHLAPAGTIIYYDQFQVYRR